MRTVLNDRRRAVLLATVGLLATHAGMLAYSATRHSPTMLEPALLAAGLCHWEFGRFEYYRVNPPLVRMVAALPVLAAGYESNWSQFYDSAGARPEFRMGSDFIAANGERSIWLFTIARWGCIPFSLFGGLIAFCYARELWRSDLAGLVTLMLWCFEPNILAHAELITNDVACTAFGLGATWLFWRWLKEPTWGRASLAGVVLGLAQLSKSSWLMLFGLWPILAGVWWLAESRSETAHVGVKPTLGAQSGQGQPKSPASRNRGRQGDVTRRRSRVQYVAQLALSLLLALYLLNLGYAFDGSFTGLKDFDFVSRSLTGREQPGEVGNRFRESWLGQIPVPLPREYVLGLDTQKRDFEAWRRPNYLRGEWKHGGWWYYYLYGLWVKVPHGVQLLVLMALVSPLWQRMCETRTNCVAQSGTRGFGSTSSPRPRDHLILLVPGLSLFILVSSQTEMNEHFRYVLPTLGTLLVFAGRAAFYTSRRYVVREQGDLPATAHENSAASEGH